MRLIPAPTPAIFPYRTQAHADWSRSAIQSLQPASFFGSYRRFKAIRTEAARTDAVIRALWDWSERGGTPHIAGAYEFASQYERGRHIRILNSIQRQRKTKLRLANPAERA